MNYYYILFDVAILFFLHQNRTKINKDLIMKCSKEEKQNRID